MSKSRTQFIILAFLHHKSGSGYQIKKAIEASVAYFWSESYGQIYPVLKKMTLDGLVRLKDSDSLKQPRSNIYEITEKGKKILLEWLTADVIKSPPRLEILLKLFFGGLIGPSVMKEMITLFRSRKEKEMKTLQSIMDEFYTNPAGHAVYGKMTVRYGIRVSSALLEWCDETLEELEKLEKESE